MKIVLNRQTEVGLVLAAQITLSPTSKLFATNEISRSIATYTNRNSLECIPSSLLASCARDAISIVRYGFNCYFVRLSLHSHFDSTRRGRRRVTSILLNIDLRSAATSPFSELYEIVPEILNGIAIRVKAILRPSPDFPCETRKNGINGVILRYV